MATTIASNRLTNGAPRAALAAVLALALAHVAAGAASPAAAPQAASAPRLTAAQVVERNIAARGGAAAWQSVQALRLSGELDAGRADAEQRARDMVAASMKHAAKGAPVGAPVGAAESGSGASPMQQVQLPFRLLVGRPNRSRLEVEFAGRTAVQVYDGTQGWKLRPFLNRDDVEPFTEEETRAQATQQDFGSRLIAAAASGARIELEGTEAVEGRPAYRLKVSPAKGAASHVWVDAQSFLDVRVEGVPRLRDGRMRTVYVYQRDFRRVDGVLIPFVLETAVEGSTDTHRMTIATAELNPRLDATAFAKPRA